MSDLGVHVEALEEHEHEGGGEEEVDEDGEGAARPRVVVERGQQQADVGQDQADLHVKLDHSGIIETRSDNNLATLSDVTV